MNWQKKLEKLETEQKWDEAIAFMQEVIEKEPSMDAYINMNYLIMNLLVEEDYDDTKHDYYWELCKKYYAESYALFKDNPEYLFYTGITAVMSEWYFGITDDTLPSRMITQAYTMEPTNILFQRDYYIRLKLSDPKQREEATPYAQLVLQEDSPIKKELYKKGAIGKYIYGMTQSWARRVVGLERILYP